MTSETSFRLYPTSGLKQENFYKKYKTTRCPLKSRKLLIYMNPFYKLKETGMDIPSLLWVDRLNTLNPYKMTPFTSSIHYNT